MSARFRWVHIGKAEVGKVYDHAAIPSHASWQKGSVFAKCVCGESITRIEKGDR